MQDQFESIVYEYSKLKDQALDEYDKVSEKVKSEYGNLSDKAKENLDKVINNFY